MLCLSDAKQHTVLLSTKESMSGFVPLLFQCSNVFCLMEWLWLSITALTCVRVRAIELGVPTFLCLCCVCGGGGHACVCVRVSMHACMFVCPHTTPHFKPSPSKSRSTDVRGMVNKGHIWEKSRALCSHQGASAVWSSQWRDGGAEWVDTHDRCQLDFTLPKSRWATFRLSRFARLSVLCSRQNLPSFLLLFFFCFRAWLHPRSVMQQILLV